LLSSLDLAKNVLDRKTIKREAAHQAQNAWEKWLGLVELKRKCPSLEVKGDDEPLHDKERVPKRLRTDSTSAYAFHSNLLAEVWVTDIVGGMRL
jgi:enhancer of polycomb-like protein